MLINKSHSSPLFALGYIKFVVSILRREFADQAGARVAAYKGLRGQVGRPEQSLPGRQGQGHWDAAREMRTCQDVSTSVREKEFING